MPKKPDKRDRSRSKPQQDLDKATRKPVSMIGKSRRRPLLWAAGLVLVIVFVVWVNRPHDAKQTPVKALPSDSTQPRHDTDAAMPDPTLTPLARGLSYREYLEGGGVNQIDPNVHLPQIDHTSKLIIVPDSQRIKEIAAASRLALPSISPDHQARLNAIAVLLPAAETYIAGVRKFYDAVCKNQGLHTQLSPAQIDALQREIAEQGRQGLEFINLVIQVVEARARARYGNDEDAVVAEVGRITDPMLTDEKGRPVILNTREVGAFLSDEIDFATQIAEGQDTAQFGMWASLQTPRKALIPVGVQNYFDVSGPEDPERQRVVFRITLDEQKRPEPDLNLAREAYRFIRDLRDKRSSLRRELAPLWGTVRSELETLGELPVDGISQDASQLLVEAIDLAMQSPAASQDDKKELTQLRRFIGVGLNDDLNKITKMFQGLKETASLDEFTGAYMVFTEDLQHTLALAVHCPLNVTTNIHRTRSLVTILTDMHTPESKAMLDSLSQKALPQTTQRLKNLIDSQLRQYAHVAWAVRALSYGGQVINMAGGFDASSVRPPVPTGELAHIPPGIILLNKARAEKGDVLTVRAQLVTTDNEGEEVIHSAEESFRVSGLPGAPGPTPPHKSRIRRLIEILKYVFLAAGAVLLVAFSIWKTLPDETKQTILRYLFALLKRLVALSARLSTGPKAKSKSNTDSQ